MEKHTEANDSKERKPAEARGSSRLRTGLLVVGSAIFGGVAVAFWNRRTLGKMRENPAENRSHPEKMDDEAIY
jgi:hypothetical protein